MVILTKRAFLGGVACAALAGCGGGAGQIGAPGAGSGTSYRPTQNAGFDSWLAGFRQRAASSGISDSTIARAFRGAAWPCAQSCGSNPLVAGADAHGRPSPLVTGELVKVISDIFVSKDGHGLASDTINELALTIVMHMRPLVALPASRASAAPSSDGAFSDASSASSW